MSEIDPANLKGGQFVPDSDWTTTVDYFLEHPDYILRVNREVTNYVRLTGDRGVDVAVLCPVDDAEGFELAEHRYWARQQEGATSNARHVPQAVMDALDAERVANPRTHVDVSFAYLVNHFDTVLNLVARDAFVYVRSLDGERLTVVMSPTTKDRIEEMEDDYMGHAVSETDEPGTRD